MTCCASPRCDLGSGSARGGRHITYIGAYLADGDEQMALSDDDLRQRWFSQLHRLLPRFDPSAVGESHVVRFRNAQHVVDVDFARRIPSCQTRPGRLLPRQLRSGLP